MVLIPYTTTTEAIVKSAEIISTGINMGLITLDEWFENYMRFLEMGLPYDKVTVEQDSYTWAWLHFLAITFRGPEDSEEGIEDTELWKRSTEYSQWVYQYGAKIKRMESEALSLADC